MKIKPVILCGGAGTRLWPSSKKNLPKQFIDWGGWTLFGKTLERIKSSIFDYPIITTNSAYLNLVKKYLSKYKIKKYRIILEPFKKNTAPAILSSALIKEIPYNQPMIFFSSDNLIGKIDRFAIPGGRTRIRTGCRSRILLSDRPDCPCHTGQASVPASPESSAYRGKCLRL